MAGGKHFKSSKPRRTLTTRGGGTGERERSSSRLKVSLSAKPPRTPKAFNADAMRGRLAIRAVTMNLSGQSVMGLTPAYKINYIR